MLQGSGGRAERESSDCLEKAAVLEPAGLGPETPQSRPWWQQAEETVGWLGEATHNQNGVAG